ncbi:uncharacterized protein LOC110611879 [Manihot esculenta]|uniref:Uncharacterized protein n=1 Tax=Manihot esculenta TaxID=3983 RepID=A0A251LBZ6_MANES|nr:uncharacterized protein LOC110611879 [Manihot esculenta]OAY55850.1 hypothetical protein MANES_03G184800v8 [Manihot esculenta]OAY55851.1 hypothetical protein MANES_03G184800v8 [Manihot esculenta]
MADKGVSSVPSTNPSWLLRSNPLVQWRFRVLTALVFVGMVGVWSIDGFSVKNVIESWRFKREFLGRRFNVQLVKPTNLTREIHQNFINNLNTTIFLLPQQNTTHTPTTSSSSPPSYSILNNDDNNVSAQNYSDGFLEKRTERESEEAKLKWVPTDLNPNFTSEDSSVSAQSSSEEFLGKPKVYESEANVKWVSTELDPRLTSKLLSRWFARGGEPCRNLRTVDIVIPGLDGHDSIELSAGNTHEFIFQAVDESKNPRCLGGDYFETDLSGVAWKSRPLIKDFGNGSYSISLQVHPEFAGDYHLTVILLFRHFEGLRFSSKRFVYDKELRKVQIRFIKAHYRLPQLQICEKSDFTRDLWVGRWTRLGKNDDCEISNDGRYRCLEPYFPCQSPWCDGSLGLLESNGWVYSSHCSFRLFSADSAWNCLKNRWIFFWGDSNHVDTIRNMLNFLLDLPEIKSVPRRFDLIFSNPKDASQSVRITSIFNGHWNETQNYQGFNSLKDEGYRNLLKKYFSEDTVPDAIIMNSGLHDGVFWPTIRKFSGGVDYAVSFWKEVIDSVKQRGSIVPQIIYRTTIATGGYARALAFNPNKMEAFNWVVLDKFRRAQLLSGVIDNFDMTFAWHFDNRCNDGVHYGRAPAKMKWKDGEIGHQYFVDLMLAHVLLNALCAR